MINEITKIADEIFQDFSSFKEQLFNELASDFLDGGKHFESLNIEENSRSLCQGDLYVDFDALEVPFKSTAKGPLEKSYCQSLIKIIPLRFIQFRATSIPYGKSRGWELRT